MKIKRLHQFSAGFNPGDAISNQMLMIKNKCEKSGIKGEIYSENISPNQKKGYKFKNYSPSKGDCILYHHSIHSNVLEFLLEIDPDIPKIMLYHNVTPHHFFESYDLRMTYYLKKGREELVLIRDKFQMNLAVSDFNKIELENLGFPNVKIYPIQLDFINLEKIPQLKKDNKINIMFSGRIAPNKKQTDLIKFAKVFNDLYGLNFELQLVGYTSKELFSYREELENLIQYFHIENKVKFTEFVSQEELCKFYSNADVFLCLSEHEGFCVPIIEAMYYEIPIIAYNAGAIPETLNGAGILMNEKNYGTISSLIYKLKIDKNFKEKIIQKQNEIFELYKNKIEKLNIVEMIRQLEIRKK